ncbi:hypothetical protein [Halotia branconii]|uniref:Uncharacterized protein n=1 Tax=Halotia branconii CENA392 TaxID=1539056 RepID=A0AAJ6PC20_9CYAN|nr:hypothetical protein [Halotia branconii]WGV28321.1 hypothetical protein QI031_12985 [Halotia branconii CENA392]
MVSVVKGQLLVASDALSFDYFDYALLCGRYAQAKLSTSALNCREVEVQLPLFKVLFLLLITD